MWNKEVKKKVPPIAGNFLYHIEASKLICSVINWLVSIWWGHYSYMGRRTVNILNIFCVSFKLQHYTFQFIYNRHNVKTRVFVHLERFHVGSTDPSSGTSHRRNSIVPWNNLCPFRYLLQNIHPGKYNKNLKCM